MFLYQICMGSSVDVDLLRHVGTYGVKISIALPRFFCSLLLQLNPGILSEQDVLEINKLDTLWITH